MFQGFIDRGQGVVHSASSSTQARFQNPARTFDATATTTTAASAAAAESAFHNIDLTNTSRNNDSSSSGDVDIYNNIGSSSSSSSGGGDNFSGAIDGDVDGFTSNGDCNSADLLQLHRSFSQGDGIAERRAFFNKHFTAYSPVTVELLHMCWHPGFAPKVFKK